MKRFASASLAALFALLFAGPLALPAQNILDPAWESVAKELRPFVESAMKDSLVTGLSIALVDGDKTVWTEGFGNADAAAGKKADADTMFEIGSISKTFTGLMVMRLAEQGKLDIDRPVTDYIPGFRLLPPARDFPRNDNPITVRHMMTHFSGIPGDLLHGAFATEQNLGFNDKLLAWLSEDSATYPPGYRWSYSNTAVSLLEKVIESASGKSFTSYAQEFLDSLGMAPASYFKTDPVLVSRLSKAYDDGEEIPTTYINVPASGSIVASANHMSRYLRMLIGEGSLEGRSFLGKESFEKMLVPQYPGNPFGMGFKMGLSFILSDADLSYAGSMFWHNGATLAFRSHLEVLRDQDLGVFVVANSTSGGGAAEAIAKAVLVAALKHGRGLEKPKAQEPKALARIALPEALLKNFSGIYASDDRSRYESFTPSQGGLEWSTGPGEGGALKKNGLLSLYSDGFFRLAEDSMFGFEFKEAGGRFVFVIHAGAATAMLGERYDPAPISPAWKARLGTWAAANPDPTDMGVAMGEPVECSLSESNGLLIFTNAEYVFVLEPISDSLAAVRGLGRFGGTAMRISQGKDGGEEMRFMLIAYRKARKD